MHTTTANLMKAKDKAEVERINMLHLAQPFVHSLMSAIPAMQSAGLVNRAVVHHAV